MEPDSSSDITTRNNGVLVERRLLDIPLALKATIKTVFGNQITVPPSNIYLPLSIQFAVHSLLSSLLRKDWSPGPHSVGLSSSPQSFLTFETRERKLD
jgi:hypothetical protein